MSRSLYHTFLICLISVAGLQPSKLQAQIIINEVIMGSQQAVELKNVGDSEFNAGTLFLCSFPTYNQVQTLTVLSGSTLMTPGSILVVSGHSFDSMDDELGLYSVPSYNNPDNILDYVEWGSSGHQRSSVAQAAGIWTAGDFVTVEAGDGSIEFDGFGDGSSDWEYSTGNTQGEENSNVQGCEASAFMLGNSSICEGETASFNVILSGEAPWTFIYSLNGVNQDPVITSNSIYPLVLSEDGQYQLVLVEDAQCIGSATGAVNLDVLPPPTAILSGDGEVCGPGPGALALNLTGIAPWSVEYHINGIPQGQVETSDNPYFITANTEGTYNPVLLSDAFCDGTVSGSVDVIFNVVEAGALSFEGGNTDAVTLCVFDDIIDELFFEIIGNEGELSALLKTSASGTIHSISGSGSFIFDEIFPQELLVYHISYLDGLLGLEEGSDLAELDGCYSLSVPLTVNMSDDVGCPVSLLEWQSQGLVNVFPNPFQDNLSLILDREQVEGFSWHMTDLQGRILASGNPNSDIERIIIPTQGFSKGLYLLYPIQGVTMGKAIPLVKE
jgi:hypothetical protein